MKNLSALLSCLLFAMTSSNLGYILPSFAFGPPLPISSSSTAGGTIVSIPEGAEVYQQSINPDYADFLSQGKYSRVRSIGMGYGKTSSPSYSAGVSGNPRRHKANNSNSITVTGSSGSDTSRRLQNNRARLSGVQADKVPLGERNLRGDRQLGTREVGGRRKITPTRGSVY